MRILLDCRFQKGAGPNVQSSYLLDSLINRNPRHEFLILQNRAQTLPDYPNVPKIFVPYRKPALEFLWVQTFLPGALARNRIDLCHSLKHIGPLRTRVPTIVHVRESGHFFPEGADAFELDPVMKFYWTNVLMWGMKRATHVFGISQTVVDVVTLKLGIPKEKVSVLYNGLDERFKVIDDRAAIEGCLARYSLPERFILCVGNLYPHKNYDTVVKMYGKLRAESDDAPSLVFVGDHSYAGTAFFELIDQLELRPHIHFTDFMTHEDLVYVYNAADLLLFPPIVASFPNPTVEAMACGTPVVAVDRGSVSEITDGAALLLDEPRNVTEMLAGVKKALGDSDERRRLRELGLRRAQNFSWRTTASRVFSVYDRIEANTQ